MKIHFSFIGLTLCTSLLFSGCAVTMPFTTKVWDEVGRSADNSKQFQYYISSTIVLTLVDENKATSIEDGQLIRKSNTAREKITIRSNLPGLVRDANLVRLTTKAHDEIDRVPALTVAFEKYEGDPVLRFCPRQQGDPNYYLVYDNPDKNIVQYGNAKYVVSYAKPFPFVKANKDPYLLIKAKSSHKQSAKSRKVSGLKLGE